MRRNRSSRYLFGMIVCAIVFATGPTMHAQTPVKPTPSPTPSSSPPSLEREFVKNILRDQRAIWTSPFHLERSDLKWVVPSGIGLMALITTDRISGDEIAESDRSLRASRVISYGGSIYGVGAMAGTFYLVGRLKNSYRERETGVLIAEAAIDSVIVESALKGITQRARPFDGVERSEFFDGGNSFPSGHSAQAWAVATVIANEYKHRRAVQIAAYAMASAVSVTRFTGQKHYLSDVVAGSALGYGIGKYVYNTHHQKSLAASDDTGPVSTSRWPAISPEFNRHAHAYGIGLTWSF